MSGTDIALILVDKRTDAALKVQEILTENGCLIKTRLGIHETADCAEEGLIILNLTGTENNKKDLIDKLNIIDGIKAKIDNISFD